ncbi:cAMP-dependent protein kinase catalytic subunit 3 like [Verticillium longisporum]|uniref:cAMP-dependent protein kinase n=1 Tax=Verticillium longisporum TaxID=100787 RepID=A0A8I3AL40_VERLO|nr:cAMP-dependent protein kinase catalytic subunit 3 like [Verticillium longisporum]
MAAVVSQAKTEPVTPHEKPTRPRASTSSSTHREPGFLSRMKSRMANGKGHHNAGHGPIASRASLSSHVFRIIRTLGTGTFARVCLVRPVNPAEEEKKEVFALKILRKTEVIKLKQVDHLFSYLRKMRRFDESTAKFYTAEIVLVLEFLHEQQGRVAYRDLKPENLLLDKNGHIKLVDFGFAKRLSSEDGQPTETYTLCGTPEYLAPEVIHNKGHTTAVDWWALGILLYEFLTGYPPFWHQNPIEIYKQIVEKPVTFPAEPHISDNAKDLIKSFCTVDRSKRLGNISGGAQRVKDHLFFKGIRWDELLGQRVRGPIVPPVRSSSDSQCFDQYPEEDGKREPYTDEMARQYDQYFKDF